MSEIPVLTQSEYSDAIRYVAARLPERLSGTFLHVAGGTRDAPRLGGVPRDMVLPDITARWKPLAPGSVLVNLSPPGRLWSAHYFYNSLASAAGALTVPFEEPRDDEIGHCLDFFEDQGVTAVAASPATMRRILGFALFEGRRLPWLDRILWSDGIPDRALGELVADEFPHVRTWGVYGTAETWMIGHSGPDCPPGVFHVFPHQYVEVSEDGILVTTVRGGAAGPLLRYRVGRAGTWETCRCGGTGPALRVRERVDSMVELFGRVVAPEDLVGLARQMDMVDRAQVALIDPGTGTERMYLRVTLRPGVEDDPYTTEWIRSHVVAGDLGLAGAVGVNADSFDVVVVDRLARGDGRTEPPLLVVERTV
ncbi:AMP-dependent synthetase [Actinorugispora endophytica]|uniref:AMP-dependent synthetase n=1 Tax=Actinorugispora endophytica TaxID=1605990 RepID=UPI001060ADFC|nr:AMP-dependent synthetase [Actinorugispora endophytica]